MEARYSGRSDPAQADQAHEPLPRSGAMGVDGGRARCADGEVETLTKKNPELIRALILADPKRSYASIAREVGVTPGAVEWNAKRLGQPNRNDEKVRLKREWIEERERRFAAARARAEERRRELKAQIERARRLRAETRRARDQEFKRMVQSGLSAFRAAEKLELNHSTRQRLMRELKLEMKEAAQ